MKVDSRLISLPGPRGENQDSWLEPVTVKKSSWMAVADGVGGHRGGAVASATCIEALKEAIRSTLSMEAIFEIAQAALVARAAGEPEFARMSTTLSVLRIGENKAVVGHVGDSRILHFRRGGVIARTRDQTEVQRLLDEGVLSPYQAKRYPRKNVLISYLSPEKSYSLHSGEFDVQVGDRLLLSTDGFHSLIPKRTIAAISAKRPTFEQFWNEIDEHLRTMELTDDATCLAIEISE